MSPIVNFIKRSANACAALLLAATAYSTANADVIAVSYTSTLAGTTGTGTVSTPSVPGSHTYGNSLPTLSSPVYTAPGGQSYEFYDNYLFTVSGASANSLTSSINLGSFLGLDDFQVRLYGLAGNPSTPVFGTPAGGTLVQAWSSPISFSPGMTGLLAVIPEQTLVAGTYVLQVRGNVSGTSGGSYSGVLNLTPVPIPAAAWLLFSGLGALGAFRRKVQV